MEPDRKRACLVLGDLCLDVHAHLDILPDRIAPLTTGSDVTAPGDVYGLPGGTTWLFADALANFSDIGSHDEAFPSLVPVMMTVVGADWAGDFLINAATARGWPADGITRAVRARTDIVATTSFAGRARLMAIPTDKVSRKVLVWDMHRLERICELFDVRFAWVSGYLFEDYDNTVAEGARAVLGHLREIGVPIVVDLVPHDFLAKVGHLGQLEAAIGPIDFIVGEFGTLVALGFGQVAPPDHDPWPSMMTSARSAALGRVGSVVQHRISSEMYAQVVSGQSIGELKMSKAIPLTGPRGIGDALAVEALDALGLIRQHPIPRT